MIIPPQLPEITPEMLAAGLEVLQESRTKGLSDADMLRDAFWAMYGIGHYHEPETWH